MALTKQEAIERAKEVGVYEVAMSCGNCGTWYRQIVPKGEDPTNLCPNCGFASCVIDKSGE